MLSIRALDGCHVAFYGANAANNFSNLCRSRDKPVIFYVTSYGIGRTWNILRHIYLVYRNVEIHPGMTNDRSAQLTLTTRNYYGEGRIEGRIVYCVECADRLLNAMSDKARRFHLIYNNCDTIVPVVMQTALLWISVLGLLIGVFLTITRHGTFNAFIFSLFVPSIATAVMFLNNKIDRSDRHDCLLSMCRHVIGN